MKEQRVRPDIRQAVDRLAAQYRTQAEREAYLNGWRDAMRVVSGVPDEQAGPCADS